MLRPNGTPVLRSRLMPTGKQEKMTASQRWTMLAVVLGSGIVFLDTSVVTVALPRIGNDLPRSFVGKFEGQSYVYNAYLLALSSLLIIAGALNDRYGRRFMFLVGMVGFGITSALCGLAWSMESLILFRAFQGGAGAILVPSSLALIRASFSGEKQGRAFGIWAGASGATTVFGPVLGGFLVDAISWRAAFLINLPLIAIGIYATAVYVTESRDPEAVASLDWGGAAVAFLAVGGLSLGAIRGQDRQWNDTPALIAIAVGFASAIWFPILMRRRRDPLVSLHLFRSRNFSVTNLSTFLIYGSLYAAFFFITLFLQGSLDYSATAAGVALFLPSLLLAIFSARVGSMAARLGPRRFMILGPILMALGFSHMSLISTASASWQLDVRYPHTFLPPNSFLTELLPGTVLFGIGLVIMVAPLTMAVMTSVSESHAGVASAFNNAVSRVGPQLAAAVIFVAVTGSFYDSIGQKMPELDTSSPSFRQQVTPFNPPEGDPPPKLKSLIRAGSRDAFQLTMLITAGLMAAGAAVNVAIRDEDAFLPGSSAQE